MGYAVTHRQMPNVGKGAMMASTKVPEASAGDLSVVHLLHLLRYDTMTCDMLNVGFVPIRNELRIRHPHEITLA